MTHFPAKSIAQDLWAVLEASLHPAAMAELKDCDKAFPISVACSGGADSVCTFWILHAWAQSCGARLQVLHFNHGLRGEHSEGDAVFVEELAKHLGWLFFSERAPSMEGKAASETTLRTLRHAFFKKIVDETGSRVIVLGHHLDDVAETFLMRWLRGSGARGLSAPRPVQVHAGGVRYVRPLLNLKKRQVEDELKSLSISWRVDASNKSDDYLRNRIRNHVIPVLENIGAHPFYDGVLRSRALLEEDDTALESVVDSIWPHVTAGKRAARWESVLQWPKGVVRRLLWRYLNTIDVILDSSAFETLLDAIIEQKSVTMSVASGFLRLEKNQLQLVSGQVLLQFDEVLSKEGAIVILPDGSSLKLIRAKVDDAKLDNKESCWIPFGVKLPLQVRSWRPADGYVPLGAPGFKKLQDQFVDRKIPQEIRGCLPVVVDANEEVLWVPGLVPSEKTRLGPSEKEALKLIWCPVASIGL